MFSSVLFYFPQSKLRRLSAYLDTVHWLLKLLLEDLVYIVQSIICITHWRGFWVLLDKYDRYRPGSAIAGHFISFLLMTFTVSAQNLLVRGCVKDGTLPEGKGIELNTSYLSELIQFCRSKKQEEDSKLNRNGAL
ncbi:hypothetical protein ElyMa_006920000 [Elysia marginata]|uniref:Uncharacterized protein n=1 Tax=Elysia marginata TaxID=1093978 RepID=A0AAV4JFZ8_9GAST|nr:hypothetical protein ElyMa_006920000 [Elysia marginata]